MNDPDVDGYGDEMDAVESSMDWGTEPPGPADVSPGQTPDGHLSDDTGLGDDEMPPPPSSFGAGLDPVLRQKLHALLWSAPGQLGEVYRAMVQFPAAGPTELHELANCCANPGAVGNRRVVVLAIMNGEIPSAVSRARQAASSIRPLLKPVADTDVREHLSGVLHKLEDQVSSPEAVAQEVDELESNSADLAEELKQASGVYVYTYPHYWRHPYVPGTERRLLKIGRTSNGAWGRVIAQARQTGMPEDPLLLRVYATKDPVALENKFHKLLDAAEHVRSSGTAVGKEWFTTTVEFCDTIAAVLGVQVHNGGHDEVG
jgi:hypothetical protein